MIKKYDLIVVGAGPAGLTAAKIAGENGLDVALIERKTDITDIKRLCTGMLHEMNEYSFGERPQFNARDGRICFPVSGFSLKYDGFYKNLYGNYSYSPNGNRIEFGNCDEGRKRGDEARIAVVYDKETFLRGLLDEAKKCSVEVFPGINVIDIKKKEKGACVIGNGNAFEGVFVIASDGTNSRIAQRLGFNQGRKFYGTLVAVGWHMKGVEPPVTDAIIQVMGGQGKQIIFCILARPADDEYTVLVLGFDPEVDLLGAGNYFMSESKFSPWFKKAEKLKMLTAVENVYSPISEPFRDNVLLVGDAAWSQEAEITGAIMCGWKAAHSVTVAILDKKFNREGILDYLQWWRKAFFDRYDPTDHLRAFLLPYVLKEDEINYLYSLVKDPMPACMNPYTAKKLMGEVVIKIKPEIESKRPEIIPKLRKYTASPPEEILDTQIKTGFPNR